jgi:hypothetical protein
MLPRDVKFYWAIVVVMVLGCRRAGARRVPTENPVISAPNGLYWGRWDDVPDGVRVQVWLHGTGNRVRGTWELPPWHGEFGGQRTGDGFEVEWREEAVVAMATLRMRRLHLRVDSHGILRGAYGDAGVVELVPAGAPATTLRPGVWLSRWTGLPHGMGVETLLSRTADGRWRAAYHYQDREGTFEGDDVPRGALAIHWREMSSRDGIAQGNGLLLPAATGLFGTYGVGDRNDGTGFWSLEPME